MTTPPDVSDRFFESPPHVVLEGDLILARERALQPISTAQVKWRQTAAIVQVVERPGDRIGEMFPAVLKNVTLDGRGNTREQLGQRGVSILETYRVAGAQRIKGDPVIETFHSATFEDAQRLQSRSSAQ